ncbi:hypothetical protein FXO38_17201 [Capsicum annuum]|nr:hypothetical protein FXO38_17201 [Capsicum annuum]
MGVYASSPFGEDDDLYVYPQMEKISISDGSHLVSFLEGSPLIQCSDSDSDNESDYEEFEDSAHEDDILFDQNVNPYVETFSVNIGGNARINDDSEEFISKELQKKMQNEDVDSDCVVFSDMESLNSDSDASNEDFNFPKHNLKTDDANPKLALGQIFQNKKEFKEVVTTHEIKRGRTVEWIKDDSVRARDEYKPIIKLLEIIRHILMARIAFNRDKAEKWARIASSKNEVKQWTFVALLEMGFMFPTNNVDSTMDAITSFRSHSFRRLSMSAFFTSGILKILKTIVAVGLLIGLSIGSLAVFVIAYEQIVQGVELSETVRKMEESISQVILLLEAAVKRCINYFGGSEVDELIPTCTFSSINANSYMSCYISDMFYNTKRPAQGSYHIEFRETT